MLEIGLFINTFEQFFFSMFIYYIFVRIVNDKININIKLFLNVIVSAVIAILYNVIKSNINSYIAVLVMCVLYSLFCSITTKNKIGYSMLVVIISLCINYTLLFASIFITFIINEILETYSDFITLVIIVCIYGIFVYLFFKIRRFKNGFTFLQNKSKNDYIDIFVLSISIIVIFIALGIALYDVTVTKYLFIELLLVAIIMIVVIQKTFTLYYKQQLLEKTVKQYESDLQEKDKEIEKLSGEKFHFMKVSHEFYNRQKALELKVNEFINNSNMKTEFGAEIDVLDRISRLSKEYSKSIQKSKYIPKLPTTNVEGIDDIFRYMQSECEKNNIDFSLQLNGNINYIVNNVVPQDKLETLIGDHIRDAIIAVNSSDSKYRNIIAMLGVKDNFYQFSVYDSGIEFEIPTLIELGLKPVTTHKDTGGTGIGFMTTFETLSKYKASLIIEEKPQSQTDYTKVITIRFDEKNEYRICSYRACEIALNNTNERIIIEEHLL